MMPTGATRSKLLDAVAAVVAALALPDAEGVYVRSRERRGENQSYPCVEVRRAPGPDAEVPMTLESDGAEYGFLVLFKYRDPLGAESTADERADGWYERIAHAFRNVPTALRAAVPRVTRVTVEPAPALDPQAEGYQNVQGGLTVRVLVDEPRGPLPA
jgi:hypothetical protein